MKKTKLSTSYGIMFILAFVALSVISIFNACKKQVSQSQENEIFSKELATYHESADYKNLLAKYPNQKFVDLPIIDANKSMKAIITNIVAESDELVRAITYFEPAKGFNIWYPTFVLHVKANDGNNFADMLKNNSFSGSFQLSVGEEVNVNLIKLQNNKIIEENIKPYSLRETSTNIGASNPGSKLALAAPGGGGGGVTACAAAVNVCLGNEIHNMGWIAYGACVLSAPNCISVIIADCTLHEKDCLGLPKNL